MKKNLISHTLQMRAANESPITDISSSMFPSAKDAFYVAFADTLRHDDKALNPRLFERDDSVIKIQKMNGSPFWMVKQLCWGRFPMYLGKFAVVGHETDTPEDIVKRLAQFAIDRELNRKVLGPFEDGEDAIKALWL